MRIKEPFFYEFGSYLLDPENKLLFHNEEVVPLPPKLFDTLYYLVANSGKTLFKEEILENVWSETFVEEGNLAQIIFHLRKILGQGKNSQIFIKTMPKRGYRFVASVKIITNNMVKSDGKEFFNGSGMSTGVTSDKKAIATNSLRKYNNLRNLALLLLIGTLCALAFAFFFSQKPTNNTYVVDSPTMNRSLAVLPFQLIDEEINDKKMSFGMADALITKLSNLDNVRVRPTSAIIQTKQSDPLSIGRELLVDNILTGTIQQTSDQIRVTVQLVNIKDGSTVWADKFDTSVKNIFEVQDNISEQVSHYLKQELSKTENKQINKRYTNNIEAFEAYNKGRYFWNKRTPAALTKSSEYFQKAIRFDPQYALAYAGLADCYLLLASEESNPITGKEYKKKAKTTAIKAIEIDDTLAEPHTTLASIMFEENNDWDTVEKEFLKSIELNPNYSTAHHWYSLHLFSVGQFEKAESEINKALQIDPVSLSINNGLGLLYLFQGKYQFAKEQFQKTLELDPNFPSPNYYLPLALFQLGNIEESLVLLGSYVENHPKDLSAKFSLGYLLAAKGDVPKAQNLLSDLEKVNDTSELFQYTLAMLNANVGNTEKAFDILKKVSASKNLNLVIHLKYDPRLNILRQDYRFQEFISTTK